MTTRREEDRRIWLSLEAIVGMSAIELDHLDDSAAETAREPSEGELALLGARVPDGDLAAMRAWVDEQIKTEWRRRREAPTKAVRPARVPLPPDATVADLLSRRAALIAQHPGLAQYHRDLGDDQAPDVLRAQVEDMEALIAPTSDADDET